jgi:hypothetical protein
METHFRELASGIRFGNLLQELALGTIKTFKDIYRNSLGNSLQELASGTCLGNLPWELTLGTRFGNSLRELSSGTHFGNLLQNVGVVVTLVAATRHSLLPRLVVRIFVSIIFNLF